MNNNQILSHLNAHAKQEWANVSATLLDNPSGNQQTNVAGDNTAELENLKNQCLQCTKCELYKNAIQLVFGDGNPNTKLVFIGEAPGEEEDKQGITFVGRAGKLLNKTLVELGSSRADIFICNVLKHRPPSNRNPLPNEIEVCSPWLHQQLAIIKPRLIITMGNFSTKLLLNTETGITRMRGRVHQSDNGYHIFPIFHPAAILRSMGKLPEWREDLRLALEIANKG